MIWNVFNHDFNHKKIEVWNIFAYRAFREDVEKLLKEVLIYEEFSDRLQRLVLYYFWSKAEFEVVITSWPPYVDTSEIDRLLVEREKYPNYRSHNIKPDVRKKIDVYEQLQLNWKCFADYVWSFKEAGEKI